MDKNRAVHMVFIDLKMALVSVLRTKMRKGMQKLGIPEK